MNENNGGAAFPRLRGLTLDSSRAHTTAHSDDGMTLRDYFAAHAPETPDMQTFPIKQWTKLEVVELGGGLKGPRDVLHQESWAERSARWAIEYADAMIAERAQ